MSKVEIVLSIVVPMYNEAANLDAFFQRMWQQGYAPGGSLPLS